MGDRDSAAFSELLRSGWGRLSNSSVLWNWVMNGLRLGSGFILLPLLLRVLDPKELGMYYVFVPQAAFAAIVDFGFSVSIARYVSYAMSGAREFKAQGLVPVTEPGPPNMELLWRLLHTTRQLFRRLSALTLLLMGVVGTYTVSLRVHETTSPAQTWLAWTLVLVAAVAEVYAGWWTIFLRGMNDVLQSTRIAVVGYAVRLVLSCALLLLGAKLLAVPIASLVGSALQREWSRRRCLRLLGPTPARLENPQESLLALLWPNSWRIGVQLLSGWGVSYTNSLVCVKFLGLGVNAQYGLSLQISQILGSMSGVWLAVKWPIVAQYWARQDHDGLCQLLGPRLWLQNLTYVAMAVPAWFLAPSLVHWWNPTKEVLPDPWLGVLLLAAFFEMQFSFWTMLLSMENRIPSLWPTVATNALTAGVVLLLVRGTSLGAGALVLGPFLCSCLFSYWYWPIAGARRLRTSLLGFLLRPPNLSKL